MSKSAIPSSIKLVANSSAENQTRKHPDLL